MPEARVSRGSLAVRIALPFLVLLVASTALASWLVSRSVRQFHVETTAAGLEVRARLAADTLAEAPAGADLKALAVALGQTASARLTLIDASGRVLGDSVARPEEMDDHSTRPEVLAASAGEVGRSVRASASVQTDMLYVALPPLSTPNGPIVVRASLPLHDVALAVAGLQSRIASAAVAVALLGALASVLLARRVGRPLGALVDAAERYAAGDFSGRVAVPDLPEIATLAVAHNRMASLLEERLATIRRQAADLTAILASMEEGILALDAEGRVLTVNAAAARQLGAGLATAAGRTLRELALDSELDRLVSEVLATGTAASAELALGAEREHAVEVHCTRLSPPEGDAPGALLVLRDVTRLRRLEDVRRDFVANVSHELQTPVTAVLGALETLRSRPGGGDAATTERFAAMAHRQASRLSAIIADLLVLSRLEAEGGGETGPPEPIRPVLDAAVEACAALAAERHVTVDVRCAPGLAAVASPRLLERAVVNLVDNAVKHSAAGSTVSVEADQDGDEACIRVTDRGTGIPPEHLSRIFERFYRVDRSRSRVEGGTGLGLAIVKHVAQVHGGRVSVRSDVGKGSTFAIHLPGARSPSQ